MISALARYTENMALLRAGSRGRLVCVRSVLAKVPATCTSELSVCLMDYILDDVRSCGVVSVATCLWVVVISFDGLPSLSIYIGDVEHVTYPATSREIPQWILVLRLSVYTLRRLTASRRFKIPGFRGRLYITHMTPPTTGLNTFFWKISQWILVIQPLVGTLGSS